MSIEARVLGTAPWRRAPPEPLVTPPRGGKPRGTMGGLRNQILTHVLTHPGCSPAELRRTLGPTAYWVAARLARRGQLHRTGGTHARQYWPQPTTNPQEAAA